MDERAALTMLERELGPAGDDAAVVDGLLLTTDMLHESTDFPAGTTAYTIGWRSVGASLSDVAAMGGAATAAVAVYAAPTFDRDALRAFVSGARDVCELVSASYVGGDLDAHDERTVVSTVLGRASEPVYRSRARPGDLVCVTGTFGRSAAAVAFFENEDDDRANELFRFTPRVDSGREIGTEATAMMDSSDGLARSLHQLSEASDCGFSIQSDRVPIDEAVADVAPSEASALELATTFGEDFELVFTIPEESLERVRSATAIPISVLGTVEEPGTGVSMDGDPLADTGYTH